MVFGTAYCGISHLEINHGDECILLPLGFRMKCDFSRYGKADVNTFAYLYAFIAPPVYVIYGGNPACIKYKEGGKYHKAGGSYEEHELYMLIHKEFYENLITDYDSYPTDNISYLSSFNTITPIYDEHISRIKYNINGSTEVLNWIQNIYKVAYFMGDMGIQPGPNWTADQRQTGELYEKIRRKTIISSKENEIRTICGITPDLEKCEELSKPGVMYLEDGKYLWDKLYLKTKSKSELQEIFNEITK